MVFSATEMTTDLFLRNSMQDKHTYQPLGGLNSMEKQGTDPQDITLCDNNPECCICWTALLCPCYILYQTGVLAEATEDLPEAKAGIGNKSFLGLVGLIGCFSEFPIHCLAGFIHAFSVEEGSDPCCNCLSAVFCTSCLLTRNFRKLQEERGRDPKP
jgi:hypothetical protein